MAEHTNPYQLRFFLNPLHWPMWLVVGILWLSTRLPYGVIQQLSRGLGSIGYMLIRGRRKIILTNIRLAFPELDDPAQRRLARESFDSAAMMLFEMVWAWWAPEKQLRPLVQFEGLERLQQALALGRGAILLGSHFTTLEIQGRFMAFVADKLYPTYKRAHNSLFELLMTHNRRRMNTGLVASSDMRGILRLLKQGNIIWYAPDQDFGAERSVFAPFMGVQTATLTMTARLARASRAPVLPLFCARLPGARGYRMTVGAALADFPSDDDVRDATAINVAIESQVRRVPDQYIWGHRRFKTRPHGEAQLYPPKRRHLRTYSYLLALLSLPVIGYTLWTALRQRDMAYLRERLGLTQAPTAALLVHAASIGEVKALLPLLELILAQQPALAVLFSVNTPSGRRTAQQALGDRVRYTYMPIDWRRTVYRYLAQINPQCVLIMETELWPNFSECCWYRGIRNIIVNARLSARSLDTPRAARNWLIQTVQYLYAVLARSEEDAARYLALGAHPDYVKVVGNLKFAAPAAAPATPMALGREYVLLASSRDGEEQRILRSWLSLPGDKPLLVIVPRHIHRLPVILRELQPLTPALAVRSRREPVTETSAVYIADTFGELDGFIAGARFVIMGGSFEPFGGQNILEVARAGKAVVFGPHMENFQLEAQAFVATGAAARVENDTALSGVLQDLLHDAQTCQIMGRKGRQLMAQHADLGRDYLRQLQACCPRLACQPDS